MRVLFLSTHLNAGGITSYMLLLGKGLVHHGHTVLVASSGGDTREQFTKAHIQTIDLNIKTKSEIDPKIYLALNPLVNVIYKNKIDVIHAQTRITQVMATWLSMMTGKPFVSTCHGYFKTRLFRMFFPCWGEKVIAISQAVYNHLADDFKIPTEKIAFVESGIDLNEFRFFSEEEKARSRKEMGLDKFNTIGIIARLSDVKGQDILLQAMPHVLEKNKNVKLVLVGEGKTEKLLKEMVISLKIENEVLFFPVVSKTRLMMAPLDIFVMPSRQEGLGLSILEAQACGIPVIGSKVGGIVSLIEDEKTGLLFEPQNPKALAEAILKLLNNKKLGKEMILNARRQVEERFSQEHMVEKTIDVYKSVMG